MLYSKGKRPKDDEGGTTYATPRKPLGGPRGRRFGGKFMDHKCNRFNYEFNLDYWPASHPDGGPGVPDW